jgi:ribosomal protein L6P/L9E
MKNVPRGLIIAILIGMVSGLVVGIFENFQYNHEQLVFQEGYSISIVTEKIDFELGEQIHIKIINSGTIPLTFPDTSYGLKVTGLDGVLYYTPMAAQIISTLEPKEEKTFVWNQKRMDGSDSLEGIYKIVVEGFDHENNKVKKSIVINVLK